MSRRRFSCPFHQANINSAARANWRETRRPARRAAAANVFHQEVRSYPDVAASAGGGTAGKTPQDWKKEKDERGSIRGGDVEDGDSGSAVAGNPGKNALLHQTLEMGEKTMSS